VTEPTGTFRAVKVSQSSSESAAWHVALDFGRNAVGLSAEQEGPAFSFLAAGPIPITLNEVAKVEVDATGRDIVLRAADVNAAFRTMQERGIPCPPAPRPVLSPTAAG
jgi:hypothetical protein